VSGGVFSGSDGFDFILTLSSIIERVEFRAVETGARYFATRRRFARFALTA
jgi:hypothetical protein